MFEWTIAGEGVGGTFDYSKEKFEQEIRYHKFVIFHE